jgi:preprotein translocase subunit YajC
MVFTSIFLQAAPAASPSSSSWSSLVVLALIFVVFYFFMIRPQNKKQKDIQKARAALKSGDRVVTSGGIFGKIREVKEDSFIIEISDNVRIRVEKSAVFAAGSEPSASVEKK